MFALFVFTAVMSFTGIVLTVLDKIKAKNRDRRISEATLFTVAALGGALFMFLTMLVCRHKTRHLSFMLGLPGMMVYQGVLVYLILT